MKNSLFWDYIDAILVINLDDREDRWEAFQKETNDYIPHDKVHRISATLGRQIQGYGQRPWFRGKKRDLTWAARAGCTLSHRSACIVAQENNWDTILVLEDDVELATNATDIIDSIQKVVWESEYTWDVCYLGYTEPQGPYKVAVDNPSCKLVQFSGCNATHAYLLRANARDWIARTLPEPKNIWLWTSKFRAIDRWYRRNLSRHFIVTALNQSLVNQSYGFSDIECRNKSLEDEACIINISGPFTPSSLFAWHLQLKNIKNRILLTYDSMRSLIKRLNGY